MCPDPIGMTQDCTALVTWSLLRKGCVCWKPCMFLLSTGEMTGVLLVSSVDVHVLDGPWMSTVTWAPMDTLTEGCTLCVYVPGWSMDVHSYLGTHGYTLTEGCTLCVYVPGWSMDVHSYLGIHGYPDRGVHPMCVCPWMVHGCPQLPGHPWIP